MKINLPSSNPQGEVYVQDLIDTVDHRDILRVYDRKVKDLLRKSNKSNKDKLAKLRKEFNWKGRTGKSLFEAVANQINKETRLKPVAKVYRGMIGVDLGEDNMLRHLMEYGSGVHWATRKESAVKEIYIIFIMWKQ